MEILLPKMGESVAEATIIRWVIEEGQSVSADEPIIEIATDKVDSEVPAPENGVLVKHLVAEGDVVQVGQPIAEFAVDGEVQVAKVEATPAAPAPAQPVPEAVPHVPEPAVVEALTAPLAQEPVASGEKPPARVQVDSTALWSAALPRRRALVRWSWTPFRERARAEG